jgi:putative membrane protein
MSTWKDWTFGWGWFLWLGFVFLMFSNIGNWGYTYRAHRRFGEVPRRSALDILADRYARGEINVADYGQMKSELNKA